MTLREGSPVLKPNSRSSRQRRALSDAKESGSIRPTDAVVLILLD